MTTIHHELPKEGWQGLVQNWKNDLVAAISVALVALPLCLGIAIGCEFPPISGLITAIVGGIITTFFRGSHLGINGPAAGLIAVTLSAYFALGENANAVLAVFIVAGGLQILLGVFKMGKIGNMVPSYVIHGILAAIGLIILSGQISVMLGSTVGDKPGTSFEALMQIPNYILQANPFVALIGITSLIILVIYPKIENKFIHFIPAAVWVLAVTVPLILILGFPAGGVKEIFNQTFNLDPTKLLITIPDNLLEGLFFPDFSMMGSGAFWVSVISLTLISAIEILAIGKAVDKIDPYKRNSNLNKDLIGNGIGSILAACIGGLPMITVIARSSVNVTNGAKTKWSNFYHGILLLIIVVALTPIIQKVPRAALAAILVYTGYKLARPEIWKNAISSGWEQLLFFGATLFGTLFTDLLTGIFIGIGVTFIAHWLITGLSFPEYWKYIRYPKVVIKEEDNNVTVQIGRLANFTTILPIKKAIENIPDKKNVIVNLAGAKLVDFTVLEFLHEYSNMYKVRGGSFKIEGLNNHRSSSEYPWALRVLPTIKNVRLTTRQRNLKEFAEQVGAKFKVTRDWYAEYYNEFHYFETRPVEYKSSCTLGEFKDKNISWEISDITFEEGALLYSEKHKTTSLLLKFPYQIPVFSLEKEQLFDKVMSMVGFQDIDFEEFKVFSDKFHLIGRNETEVRAFFSSELIKFFNTHEIYHIESNGEALYKSCNRHLILMSIFQTSLLVILILLLP